MAQPTPRIMSLAKPKKIFDGNLQRRLVVFRSALPSVGKHSLMNATAQGLLIIINTNKDMTTVQR